MRDDIYRQVNLGTLWNRALKACNAALGWEAHGRFRVETAVASELRNSISPRFWETGRGLPGVSPAAQASLLESQAVSVRERAVVEELAGLPDSVPAKERFTLAAQLAVARMGDEVCRAVEIVADGGAVLAARVRHVFDQAGCERFVADRIAGRRLHIAPVNDAIAFDDEDLTRERKR